MSETTVSKFDELVAALPDENVTPYQIWKLVSIQLEERGLKGIPSQMLYNYARNGGINGTKACKRYKKSEVLAFVEKYVTKRTTV